MASSPRGAALDEYDDVDDFAEFTNEDFASLDAQLLLPSTSGAPRVQIELEKKSPDSASNGCNGSHNAKGEVPAQPTVTDKRSPFQRFRKRSHFSVSDLVAPTWCEYQFDYGLRQKRHQKLETRPDTFVTQKGKELVVDKAVAIKREAALDKGKTIHKKLEQEIRAETIFVDAATKEERWALRILDIMACFDDLVRLGCAREMPVFGIVGGHPVVGIIDEVLRKPLPSRYEWQATTHEAKKRPPDSGPTTPQKPKRFRTDTSQHSIPQYFEASGGGEGSIPRKRKHILQLNDTKTTRRNSVPPHDYTLTSRLQLMMYYRFLDDILSRDNFSPFWERLGLDPEKRFSDAFTAQTGLFPDGTTSPIACLNDFTSTGLWRSSISRVDSAFIDPTLRLIYRSSRQTKRRVRKLKGKEDSVSAQEQADIARAIAASLNDSPTASSSGQPIATGFTMGFETLSHSNGKDQSIPNGSYSDQEQADIARAIAASLNDCPAALNDRLPITTDFTMASAALDQDTPQISEDSKLLLVLQQSMLTNLKETEGTTTNGIAEIPLTSPAAPEESGEATEDENDFDASIVGNKDFKYDAKFLDAHVQDVLDYWEGRREPRGVTIEQSGRCFTCEYREGCEWREQKALEDMERRRRKKESLTIT
uniref:Exonuclease v n=1 Tax=Moniliophthora roreri TaxID=221103 RepID=A0A0W0G4P1_MONRR